MNYRPTEHGENIASQIPGEDCFGQSGEMNPADIFRIVDAIHTNLCAFGSDEKSTVSYSLARLMGEWMESLSQQYNID